MTRKMKDIEHTNPHTGEAFGANGGVFTRGPAAADGGTEGDEMRDVEHTAPDGDGANEVWERGPDREETDETPPTDETDEAAPTDEVKADGTVPDPEETTDE
ncbi:hypothetical protein [Salinigranum salinum]|uniref:hypothetical protein n=1 Tax=Salinigranum salinum TaxID=1364937 RepID=UPI001F0384E6|nr:hypothetical protein [Salinigranum salinum]